MSKHTPTSDLAVHIHQKGLDNSNFKITRVVTDDHTTIWVDQTFGGLEITLFMENEKVLKEYLIRLQDLIDSEEKGA